MDKFACNGRGVMGQRRALRARSLPRSEKSAFKIVADSALEQHSMDGQSSCASFDRFSSGLLSDSTLGGSPREIPWDEESLTNTSVESSPLVWESSRMERPRVGKLPSLLKSAYNKDTSAWEEKKGKPEDANLSEVEMMKERFAKILLGEDFSGGGKGVSTALAISNAITNLSASVFGELWRLEPMAPERKARWRREMEWLLSVSDYIVEFVPSCQTLPDGSTLEVMVTKPRSDLHMNLPALRKLDTMLLESLDGFTETEFWYVARSVSMAERDGGFLRRQEEKWWLPTPRVPPHGLCEDARKYLQHQKDSISQILKAALVINGQVLSEMEVPSVYYEALPKNGRSSLGETMYRSITSEYFAPEALISLLDSSNEHNVLDLVNRVEAAICIWRRKIRIKKLHTLQKDGRLNSRTSRGLSKDFGGDLERQEIFAERAESLLILIRQKFPGLPQTILDMNKIQYNRDVGQSLLESYSRVLESLAFNIMSRIDDVLYVDNMTKEVQSSGILSRTTSASGALCAPFCVQLIGSTLHCTPAVTAPVTSTLSDSPRNLPSYTLACENAVKERSSPSRSLSDHMGWSIKPAVEKKKDTEIAGKTLPVTILKKSWSYTGKINASHSPPSRD